MDNLDIINAIEELKQESKRHNNYFSIWPCIVIKEALIRKGIQFELIRGYRHVNNWFETYYWLQNNGIIYDICKNGKIYTLSLEQPTGLTDISFKAPEILYRRYLNGEIEYLIDKCTPIIRKFLENIILHGHLYNYD